MVSLPRASYFWKGWREEHINTVIGHFKGAVPSWDVVNEALNDDGSMRVSKWQQIIGDDFVEKAFDFLIFLVVCFLPVFCNFMI